jgi:hypothetical protein
VEKVIIKVHSKHAKYGCINCLDGWNDVSKCPLINVMSISLFLVLFLRYSINSNGEIKTTQFFIDAIIMMIEALGSTNVLQVCMDKLHQTILPTNCLWNNSLMCMHKDVLLT